LEAKPLDATCGDFHGLASLSIQRSKKWIKWKTSYHAQQAGLAASPLFSWKYQTMSKTLVEETGVQPHQKDRELGFPLKLSRSRPQLQNLSQSLTSSLQLAKSSLCYSFLSINIP
jgi:hypothetical protein